LPSMSVVKGAGANACVVVEGAGAAV
jgi:hypothetical protein